MLRNLSIKSRLIFVVDFLSLMCISGAVIGLGSLLIANEGLESNYEHRLVPLARLDRVVRMINQNRFAVAQALTSEPSAVAADMDAVDRCMQEVSTGWNALMQDMKHTITPDETGQLLQALKEMNQSLVRIVTEVRGGTETSQRPPARSLRAISTCRHALKPRLRRWN